MILGEIPFQFRDGLIWLEASVRGKNQQLNFLLDSGAGVSALDLTRARALGMRIGRPEPVQGINGPAIAYQVNDFQANSEGTALPKSMLAIDLQTISKNCHQPIDGILGVDFFRGRIVQIDFAARKIRLLTQRDLSLANCDVLPIKICNDAFCVPVRVAGNPAHWIRLDTGCDACLDWVASDSDKRSLERTSIGISCSSSKYVETSVQIGNRRLRIPAAIYSKPIFSGEGGLLGNGLLSKFRLTIDEPGGRVVFEKNR